MPPVITGSHLTWFLGSGHGYEWTDPTGARWIDTGALRGNEGAYASGFPYDTPGIAVPNDHHTLGEYILLELPALHLKIKTIHVDIGPRWNVVDCSAPLAYLLFKSQRAFPDYSAWRLTFLGDPPNPLIVNEVQAL